MQYSTPTSQPISLSKTGEMQVYLLFSFAIALTVVGVFIGGMYAAQLFTGGAHIALLIAEVAIILTAPLWMEKSPLNILLFAAFPIFSGIVIAPFIWAVSTTVPGGNTIIINALTATVFMTAAAAVFARTTSLDLGGLGRFLLFGVLGLIGFGLLQLFIPALRQSVGFEMALSGAGVAIFAAFTAYDMQRIQQMSRAGANPFMLALSLYLDIFNLFLYLLRFMLAIAGGRD